MPTPIVSSPFSGKPLTLSPAFETKPAFIPNVAEDLSTQDSWMEEITLTNATDNAATVTITDKQGTPAPILSTVSLEGRATFTWIFNCRFMPGGISWVCSAGSAVIGYCRWRTR